MFVTRSRIEDLLDAEDERVQLEAGDAEVVRDGELIEATPYA